LIFSEDFGFYNHLSLEKNLLSLSKILGLTVSKDDIIGGLDLLELDPNKKYQQLLENEKIKFHTLFSVLINQNILILDYSKDNLTKDDKKALRELILEHSNNANIIILDTILNHQCGAIQTEKASRLIRPPTLRTGIYLSVMCLISNIALMD